MTTTRRSARDRLLEAADQLFYEEGVHTVGIDRVLEQSGVAKGSLYYNFSGKDDLISAYLKGRHAKWAARIDEQLATTGDPVGKVLAVFDALADLFAQPDFRGCAFVNAAAEATPGSAEDIATTDFRTWLHALFAGLLVGADVQDAATLTDQLVLLYDGANISAQMDHNPAAAAAARSVAGLLLQSATASRSRPFARRGSTSASAADSP